MLELDKVSVVRAGRTLVDEVSLQVSSGELCAIIGPNGAGKSTLLRAAMGDTACTGAIRVSGAAQANSGWRERAKRVAVLPQNAHLDFDFLVREIVALGRAPHRDADPRKAQRIVEGALEAVGLASFAERRYLTLSGGEMQRTHFARVLAQVWDDASDAPGGARLLLLDEPTSALDVAQQAAALRAAWAFTRRGGAVLCVLHDLNLAAAFADRIAVMAGGVLMADAAPAELADGEVLRRAFGADLQVTAQADRWRATIRGPAASPSA